MGTLSWAFVLSALSVLAVLYVFSRRDEVRVRRDWRALLSPRSEELYEARSNAGEHREDGEPDEIAITVAVVLTVLLLAALQMLR
jgi:hypothetical protein